MKKLNLLKNIIITILLIIIIYFLRNIFVFFFFNVNIVKLPNLVNLDKEVAVKKLEKLNLKPVLIDGVSTLAERNVVLTQYPEANSKVKTNRNIQLLINSGNPKVVPNIKGMPLIKAKRILNLDNINIDRIDYYPYNGEKDIILSTYPHIGKNLKYNQGISLLVSTSNLEINNIMPNIIGLTLEQAIFLLSNSNNKIRDISYVSDETKEPDTIIYTEPQAGDKILNNYISIVINRIDKVNFDKEIDKIIKENLEELNKAKE